MGLQGWVGQLAVLVLLAGVAELLVPPGGCRAYVRPVLGLLVLLAVLRPLIGWAHAPVDWAWSAAPPPPASLASEEAATRAVFAQVLVDRVERDAADVPGVRRARAVVTLGRGQPPAVVRVQLSVESAASQPSPARVDAAVAAAVARDLDLPPSTVSVTRAPPAAPAPG